MNRSQNRECVTGALDVRAVNASLSFALQKGILRHGLEFIKLFFMLNSTESDIRPAHKR